MTTPEELRDLDRQVAEAKGWVVEGGHMHKARLRVAMPLRCWSSDPGESQELFEEMAEAGAEPHLYAAKDDEGNVRAAVYCEGFVGSGATIGEAVVRCYLAWRAHHEVS